MRENGGQMAEDRKRNIKRKKLRNKGFLREILKMGWLVCNRFDKLTTGWV
jgi:hypothetical protein